MAYANQVLARGPREFCAAAVDFGAAGVIVPDLPHEEAGELREAADSAGLALVPLVAPTSTPGRIAEVGRDARGFVYTVSLTGTTGERDGLPPGLSETVARVRSAASLPVAVGFGISTPEQAAAVAELADGVIVGTRIVRAQGEGADTVRAVVADLAAALST
jgi:tryptophan synthase alpha chain